ncbi:unnamed protein product [Gongylonema pulchrum]|uniref:DOMON domain-containing protein n=1 Tax=Gongylonema pulchrum TaxID=637853 RepID=A0A183D294_9BILA|nr:unnamed protein product [Gongylonema pulchrum]
MPREPFVLGSEPLTEIQCRSKVGLCRWDIQSIYDSFIHFDGELVLAYVRESNWPSGTNLQHDLGEQYFQVQISQNIHNCFVPAKREKIYSSWDCLRPCSVKLVVNPIIAAYIRTITVIIVITTTTIIKIITGHTSKQLYTARNSENVGSV